MTSDRGDEIIEALARLGKSAREVGLPRLSEALSDALISSFNALCDDRRAQRETIPGKPTDRPRLLDFETSR